MPVEFIGMIGTRPASELQSPTVTLTGGTVNPDYVRKFAKIPTVVMSFPWYVQKFSESIDKQQVSLSLIPTDNPLIL